MTYTILIPKVVQKQLDALPNDVYERIAVKIVQLAENPRTNVNKYCCGHKFYHLN